MIIPMVVLFALIILVGGVLQAINFNSKKGGH